MSFCWGIDILLMSFRIQKSWKGRNHGVAFSIPEIVKRLAYFVAFSFPEFLLHERTEFPNQISCSLFKGLLTPEKSIIAKWKLMNFGPFEENFAKYLKRNLNNNTKMNTMGPDVPAK